MNADEFEPNPADAAVVNKPGHRLSGQANDNPLAQPAAKRSGLAALALLFAVLALAAAGWMWWQGKQAQQQQADLWQTQQQVYQDELKRLESTVAALKDSASQQSSALSGNLQQRLQVLESSQQAGEDFRSESSAWSRAAQAALEDSQSRLNAIDEKLRNLSARSAESSTELNLEEVDYLLRMAQERLELFGDTRNADRALQLADQQIVAFDNPMFISLRRDIAAARQALAAADVPEMVTLGAEFDKVQDSLNSLPFRSSEIESVDATAADEAELSWWQRLKNVLSGLVTVHRVDEAELAMPVLADQLALRQRAWLQVEQARLAALRGEQDIYQESLAQAQITLGRWFAADNAQVRQTLGTLQALQQRQVDPPMPDISGPWTTLRSIREAGLSAAPQAAVMQKSQAEVATPASEAAATQTTEPQPEEQGDGPASSDTPEASDQ